MRHLNFYSVALAAFFFTLSCTSVKERALEDKISEYASFFSADSGRVVTVSPYDGSSDTLVFDKPFRSLVCMSGSYVAYLDAIGCDSVISAVSGVNYVSSPVLRSRYERGEVKEAGYDTALDYEAIMSVRPDLLITYTVSAAKPSYISKLEDLGIKVLILYEHLENHPLARAEYVKLFGALTGRRAAADSVFGSVRDSYKSIASKVSGGNPPAKVLVNIPYAGQWFIPGGDNYMSALIKDAGGEVLGAAEGEAESSVISTEEAYSLSLSADFWLDTGWCDTRDALIKADPVFRKFNIKKIYNNTKRRSPGGGNDFWESGAVRPDLILRDLVSIFSGQDTSLYYYIPVE